MTNSDVFLDYVSACTARDLDRAIHFYTPRSVYHNVPTPAVSGVDAIRSILEGFFQLCSAVKFEIHAIAESAAGTVLTERTDSFCINGVWRAVRVMGAVEIEGGKILAWREYYDTRQMEEAFADATPPVPGQS